MKNFLKKVLGHEIFRSIVSWTTIFFFEKFVQPSGPPSYILNVHSLTQTHWNSFFVILVFNDFFINTIFFIDIPATLQDFSYSVL